MWGIDHMNIMYQAIHANQIINLDYRLDTAIS